MCSINDRFYCGYEGEKEIQIFTYRKKLIIWEGYFDDIMEQFEPDLGVWKGAPYYYHLHIGWYDESPWKIQDIIFFLHQFEQVDLSNCCFMESKKVCAEICNIIREAVKSEEDVWIAEE